MRNPEIKGDTPESRPSIRETSDDHPRSSMTTDHPEAVDIKQTVERILASYAAGKPFFPRSLLEDLDRQLALNKDYVHIPDLDDVPQEYSLKVPQWCIKSADSYRIYYTSLQKLTNLSPECQEEYLASGSVPVSICYASDSFQSRCTLAEARRAFRCHDRAWQESATCMELKRYLATSILPVTIEKIVCFGLGPPGHPMERFSARSFRQHLAAKTISEVLKEKCRCTVRIYAQDPAYRDVDKELLNIIGITPLDDPKGFLEVDRKTLVFAVSPNIPVKQIIADVQWPAAMLWNTVQPEEEEKTEWERSTFLEEDGENLVPPYSTDPDSPRVRAMVQHCLQYPLRDHDGYFEDLTLYIRQ